MGDTDVFRASDETETVRHERKRQESTGPISIRRGGVALSWPTVLAFLLGSGAAGHLVGGAITTGDVEVRLTKLEVQIAQLASDLHDVRTFLSERVGKIP